MWEKFFVSEFRQLKEERASRFKEQSVKLIELKVVPEEDEVEGLDLRKFESSCYGVESTEITLPLKKVLQYAPLSTIIPKRHWRMQGTLWRIQGCSS